MLNSNCVQYRQAAGTDSLHLWTLQELPEGISNLLTVIFIFLNNVWNKEISALMEYKMWP